MSILGIGEEDMAKNLLVSQEIDKINKLRQEKREKARLAHAAKQDRAPSPTI